MHDDLGQQLAALSISISALPVALHPAELDVALRGLQERTCVVVDHVRDLSHECIPQRSNTSGSSRRCARTAPISLGKIGLTSASAQMKRSRRFRAIPPCACIASYRKDWKRRQARRGPRCQRVADADTDLVELTIVDHGRGFDLDDAATRGGLGLLSIEERARLVGGTFKVTSAPDQGTALHVQIPAEHWMYPDRCRSIPSRSERFAPRRRPRGFLRHVPRCAICLPVNTRHLPYWVLLVALSATPLLAPGAIALPTPWWNHSR